MNEINKKQTNDVDKESKERVRRFGAVRKLYAFTKNYMKQNTDHAYHNFNHARDVAHAALRYAKIYGLKEEDRFILLSATIGHDAYVVPGSKGNEEITAKLYEMVMPNFNYRTNEVVATTDLIRVTDLSKEPKTLLEKIMRDADTDNVGRADCIELGDKVMEELGVPPGMLRRKAQLGFMTAVHKWYTDAAEVLRGFGKKENIAKLDRIVNRGQYTTQELMRNAYKTA